jgi:hypothetical protein
MHYSRSAEVPVLSGVHINPGLKKFIVEVDDELLHFSQVFYPGLYFDVVPDQFVDHTTLNIKFIPWFSILHQHDGVHDQHRFGSIF